MATVRIVATTDGGVTFEGDTDGLPLFAPALLGRVVDEVNVSAYSPGETIHEFDPAEVS